MRKMAIAVIALTMCLFSAQSFAQTAQTPQAVIVNVDRANMRDKPSTSATVVVVLQKGEPLEVLETSGTWYRVRVTSTGKTGYIATNLTAAAPSAAAASRPAGAGSAAPPALPPSAPVTPPAGTPSAMPPTPSPFVEPGSRAPAATQRSTTTMSSSSSSPTHVGAHIFGIAEGESLSAQKSFEAILSPSKSTVTNVGFGVDVTNLWKGLFARLAYSHTKNTGYRTYVDAAGTPHSLGIPITIELAPLEVGAGWRFNSSAQGSVTIVPFVGFAYLAQGYKETSELADDTDNVDTSDHGSTIFGGVEFGVKIAKVGIEGFYRSVPNAIGTAGVSKVFNETNLGGAGFRLTFGVGF